MSRSDHGHAGRELKQALSSDEGVLEKVDVQNPTQSKKLIVQNPIRLLKQALSSDEESADEESVDDDAPLSFTYKRWREERKQREAEEARAAKSRREERSAAYSIPQFTDHGSEGMVEELFDPPQLRLLSFLFLGD